MKEKIQPYLIKWNWEGNVESFLEYWFKIEATLNEEVLNEISKLRKQKIK